ncbi:MAG: bifunctional riboflavin kinase/FAD synthetase [Eubacteriaceae bacterium]|nr:bifunctional riboflavin kinase/FAD synthetase [Eubacteriaceae bacterium]
MIVINDYKTDTNIPEGPVSCAFGYFDGLHLGHMKVLSSAMAPGMKSAVMTFTNRPMNYVEGSAPEGARLMTNEEKIAMLEEMGFDYLFMFEFNEEVMNTSKEDFILNFMCRFGIKRAVCGSDFTFGRGREGNSSNIRQLCSEHSIDVEIVEDVYFLDSLISSTDIRNALRSGDVMSARQMLGRFYSISGTIVRGRHLGRSMGFATANIVPAPFLLVPKSGVYLTRCTVDGRKYYSVSNIGTNPTVTDSSVLVLESHLFDCEEDLYGRSMKVEFLVRLRSEMRFSSIEDLAEQIGRDIDIARDFYEI